MPDPIGRACIFPGIDKPSVTVVDVCILRPDLRKVCPRWLLHKINSQDFRNAILSWLTGTTRQRISRGNLSKIEFILPPLDDQRRIAAILDKADALRRKRKRALDLLDSLTQSIFLEMFGTPAKASARLTTVANVSERVQIGPFGSILHREDYAPGGIPLINPMHIVNGIIVPSDDFAVGREKYQDLKLYHLREGDVVLGRRGEMGRCGIVTKTHHGMVCGTGSIFVRPIEKLVRPIFVRYLLSSPTAVAHFENAASGITMANLNKKIVEDFSFFLPPIDLQRRFEKIVEHFTVQRSGVLSSENKLDSLFSSLQSCAFSGQL